MSPIAPELTSSDNQPVTFSPEEWMEFRVRYSQMKHTMNNALAVFMALAELSQHNPDNFKRLADSICARTPELAALIQEFSAYLDTKGPPPPVGRMG